MDWFCLIVIGSMPDFLLRDAIRLTVPVISRARFSRIENLIW